MLYCVLVEQGFESDCKVYCEFVGSKKKAEKVFNETQKCCERSNGNVVRMYSLIEALQCERVAKEVEEWIDWLYCEYTKLYDEWCSPYR